MLLMKILILLIKTSIFCMKNANANNINDLINIDVFINNIHLSLDKLSRNRILNTLTVFSNITKYKRRDNFKHFF